MALNTIILVLSVLSFVGATVVSIGAFRAYRVVSSKQSLAFLTCFSLISVGLFLRLVVDAVIDLSAETMGFVTGLPNLGIPDRLLLLIATLCILSGYTLLLLVVDNVKKKSMWVLVFLLVAFTIVLANDIFLLTHVLAIVLTAILAHKFWKNYLTKHHTNSLLVYLGFMSMVIGHVAALFIPFASIAQIVFLSMQLLGFFLLFAMMYRVSRV